MIWLRNLIVFLPILSLAQNIVPAIQHGHFDEVISLKLDESKSQLFSTSSNNQEITWDLKTGMMVESKIVSHQLNVSEEQLVRSGDTIYKIKGPLLTLSVGDEVKYSKTSQYFDLGFTNITVQKNSPYLFASCFDGKIYVYDKGNLKFIKHLTDHNSSVLTLLLSMDGNELYSSGQDRSIIEWDVRALSMKRRFFGHSHRITSLFFDLNGDILYFGNESGQLKSFSMKGYSTELGNWQISNFPIAKIQGFSQSIDTNLILTGQDNRIYLFDPSKGKSNTLIKYHHFTIRHLRHFLIEKVANSYTHAGIDFLASNYSPSSNKMVIAANESFNRKRRKVVVKDFDSGSRKTIRSDYDKFKNVVVINDTLIAVHRYNNEDFMSAHNDAELVLWKLKKGKKYKFDTPYSSVLDIASYKNNYLLISTSTGIHCWNLIENKSTKVGNFAFQKLIIRDNYLVGVNNESAKIFKLVDDGSIEFICELVGHNQPINDVEINVKRQIFISASDDASIRFYSFKGEHLGTLIPTGQKDFILLTPENSYQITKGAFKKFGFASGSSFVFPDQFDLIFNKPHEVLSSLNIGQPEEQLLMEKAYQKRLKRMGVENVSLQHFVNLPEIEIDKYEPIGNASLSIELTAEDKDFELDRINVFVNNVAVYGSKGFAISEQNTHYWKGKLIIPLLNGNNNIEVSLLNSNGVESIRKSVRFKSEFKSSPDLYLISIGSSKYVENKYDLVYPEKDARDIVDLFSTNKSSEYAQIHTKLILNEDVTKGVLSECSDFLKLATSNDIVIVFFAGHGVLDQNYDYFLATHDLNFINPSENGISYESFEALLDGIAPLRKTLLIDACHSGELDKEDVMAITNETNEAKSNDVVFRAVGTSIKENTIGVERTNALVKELFSDLRKGTGATVISSAGGMEFAQESEEWKNGLFTYCMLEGIRSNRADANKDGKIMLSELQMYISSKVTKLSKGLQKPTSRRENDDLDWVIW